MIQQPNQGIPPFRRVICGRTQTGKTTYMQQRIIASSPAYIIYDPDKEMDALGYVVHSVSELVEFITKAGAWRLIFQPTDEVAADHEEMVAEFNELCKFIAFRTHHFQFCVDEIASITRGPGTMRARSPHYLQMLIKRRMKAPHYTGLTVTSQRMKDADVEFISQAQETIMFAMNELDAEYVAKKIGIKTVVVDNKEKRLHIAMQELRPLQYLKFNHVERRMSTGVFPRCTQCTNSVSARGHLGPHRILDQMGGISQNASQQEASAI